MLYQRRRTPDMQSVILRQITKIQDLYMHVPRNGDFEIHQFEWLI